MQKEGKVGLIIGIAVVVIVIIIIASMIHFDNYIFHPKTTTGSSSPDVIIPAGTRFDLNYGGYHSVAFQTNVSSNLNGTFSASTAVILFVVTNNQYQQFLAGTNLVSENTPVDTGYVSSYNLTFNIPAGSYYLVFFNGDQYSGASVYIDSSFVLSS